MLTKRIYPILANQWRRIAAPVDFLSSNDYLDIDENNYPNFNCHHQRENSMKECDIPIGE